MVVMVVSSVIMWYMGFKKVWDWAGEQSQIESS